MYSGGSEEALFFSFSWLTQVLGSYLRVLHSYYINEKDVNPSLFTQRTTKHLHIELKHVCLFLYCTIQTTLTIKTGPVQKLRSKPEQFHFIPPLDHATHGVIMCIHTLG